MMNLIDAEDSKGVKRFGVGHFDLVIIDEAHRSVYQKYGAIFAYFDSLLSGLTATPREEIDRNTYELFEREIGLPTDEYGLDQAVADGFLVPFKPISVPLRFPREGISYAALSDEEKTQWDLLDWDETMQNKDRVESGAINAWLFNADTVDKGLQVLMTKGCLEAGGDRIGKSVIFARNHKHAEFIRERFDHNYPHLAGKAARVIDNQVKYAQSLIDEFADPGSDLRIAISVDMLDTGIDIPEVVNLVFFKLVRSRTKFWQMIGRGTRLCRDLFGPGQHKTCFHVFDFCQNLEYFSQNMQGADGNAPVPLAKRLFDARLDLIGEIDSRADDGIAPSIAEVAAAPHADPRTMAEVRAQIAGRLHQEVAAMNFDNFIVRPHRRLVEQFAKAEAWIRVPADTRSELSRHVAGLPAELDVENEEAKRFDLKCLQLQLALLREDRAFAGLQEQVRKIAAALEDKATIPMVRDQLPLIHDVQTDAWWQDVTVPMLDVMRRRLRGLVQFMERGERRIVYTDFEDEIGTGMAVPLPGFSVGTDEARFHAKARAFLRQHLDHVAIVKLRTNRPLTPLDLSELERMLLDSGALDREQLGRAIEEARGLGLFVRSLVGLDREAAKGALAGFIAGKVLSSQQLEFVDHVVNHLTAHGVMDPHRLYESPFTDLTPTGPEGLFEPRQIDELFGTLEALTATARVA